MFLIQLQVHNNVQQYSPTLKKYVNGKNPDDYKIEHIFKGDRGDGIPNILSPDNTFTDGLRQRPLGKKKIDDWKQVGTWPIDSWNDELKRNFQRNSKLIDLSLIPDESSMFEESEYLISLFQSSNLNIKVTVKEDMQLAQSIIKNIIKT